jgi:hypothetical protein
MASAFYVLSPSNEIMRLPMYNGPHYVRNDLIADINEYEYIENGDGTKRFTFSSDDVYDYQIIPEDELSELEQANYLTKSFTPSVHSSTYVDRCAA